MLTKSGSLYLHLDYREVHYAKVLLDSIFGRDCFLNEIIWAYDYGARTKKKWPAKHDNILVYVRDPERYFFNVEEVERIPYMAPGLVGPEKAARGKLPTDTWWHTIVPTNGKNARDIPRKSRSASCAALSRLRPNRAARCSISSRAAAPLGKLRMSLVDDSCSSTTTNKSCCGHGQTICRHGIREVCRIRCTAIPANRAPRPASFLDWYRYCGNDVRDRT